MTAAFCLLVAFQVKHFLADYPLQGAYMLGKSAPGWEFVRPLAGHCTVHAVGTFLICFLYGSPAWAAATLALFDWAAHFAVDRVKASPRLLGRWKPHQRQFWMALGADQMAHHLSHYAIIWALLTK